LAGGPSGAVEPGKLNVSEAVAITAVAPARRLGGQAPPVEALSQLIAAGFIIKFVDDFFTVNFILGESTQRQ
jgi:hypothetical protein